jgi:hypothetical protein
VTRAIVALALALTAATPFARADVELPNTKVALRLDAGWHEVHAPGTVAAYRSDAGALLAVARADVTNRDAWRTKTRAAYVDQIERGVRAHVPGYRAVRKHLSEIGEVPVLDLEARRDGGATVVIRIVLFRSYALALAIEVPKAGDVAGARAIAASFAPPAS